MGGGTIVGGCRPCGIKLSEFFNHKLSVCGQWVLLYFE